MKQQVIEGSDGKLEGIAPSIIQIEAYSSGWIMNMSLVHIFMKYENWNGYSVITFKGKVGRELELALVEKLSQRMKEVCK